MDIEKQCTRSLVTLDAPRLGQLQLRPVIRSSLAATQRRNGELQNNTGRGNRISRCWKITQKLCLIERHPPTACLTFLAVYWTAEQRWRALPLQALTLDVL
jgi:hypothetical protein